MSLSKMCKYKISNMFGLCRHSTQLSRGLTLRLTLLAVSLASITSGCAVKAGSSNAWLESGSLGLSRPAPLASGKSTGLAASRTAGSTAGSMVSGDIRASLSPTALANSAVSSESSSVLISRKDQTITALTPGSTPLVLRTEGASHLTPGSFTITLKEERPLWYAPREYFVKRSLNVPSEGSRDRFKRAALGKKAIYLNNQAPIHSGPVWLGEIGGLRIDQRQMEQLYSMINVGTRVEIR